MFKDEADAKRHADIMNCDTVCASCIKPNAPQPCMLFAQGTHMSLTIDSPPTSGDGCCTSFQQILDALLHEGDIAPASSDEPAAEPYSNVACNSPMPTEPDCFSTELDTDDDCQFGIVEVSLDELMELWNGGGAGHRSQTTDDISSDFDSQLTENDDPVGPPLLAKEAVAYWSQDPLFDADVEQVLQRCLEEPWFSNEFFYGSPVGFSENSLAATSFIRDRIENQFSEFKIGITEDPYFRWWRKDCGYHWPGGFSQMFLLYAAPISKWSLQRHDSPKLKKPKQESTGAREILLIKEFANGTGNCCLDRPGAGGECPSNGSPHFVYVVVR